MKPWEKYQQAEPAGPWDRYGTDPRDEVPSLADLRPAEPEIGMFEGLAGGHLNNPAMRQGVGAVVQGATLDFGDELAGLMGGEGATDRIRQEQAAFGERAPLTKMALNVAGGVATGGLLGKAATALAPGVMGAPIAAASARSGTIIGNMAKQGAVVGGLAGTLQGAGGAQGGPIERATGAALGGVTGAALGGVVGAGLGAIKESWNGITPGVKRALQKMQESSGLSVDELEQRLDAFGPVGTIADITNNARDSAGTAASRLGVAKERIAAYERRSEQAFGRLVKPILNSMGGRAQGAQTEAQLRDTLMQQASPLYEQAFQGGYQMTPRMQQIAQTPYVKVAIAELQKIAENRVGARPDLFTPDGMPTFRGWQKVGEVLWDKGSRIAADGGAKSLKRGTLLDIRAALFEELSQQSAPFAQARQLWADSKTAEEAIQLGQKFMHMSHDDVVREVTQMDAAARPFFRLGVGRALEASLSGKLDTGDITTGLRNPRFRAKLGDAMGGQALAADFINSVRVEHEFQKTLRMVAGQSITAGRQQVAKQLGGSPIVTEGMDIARSGISEKILKLGGMLSGPSEHTIQQLGDLITSPEPAKKQLAISYMRKTFPQVPSETLARLFAIIGEGAGRGVGSQIRGE